MSGDFKATIDRYLEGVLDGDAAEVAAHGTYLLLRGLEKFTRSAGFEEAISALHNTGKAISEAIQSDPELAFRMIAEAAARFQPPPELADTARNHVTNAICSDCGLVTTTPDGTWKLSQYGILCTACSKVAFEAGHEVRDVTVKCDRCPETAALGIGFTEFYQRGGFPYTTLCAGCAAGAKGAS